MQKFSDVIQNQNGRPKAGLRIVVDPYVANAAPNLTATSAATIYAIDGGEAVPFVLTDAAGRFSFYAADGRYSLTVTGAGIVPYMLADVTLNVAGDESAPAIIGFDASALKDGAAICFAGRTSAHDGGGGMFTYSKTSTQPADGGLVFAPAGGGRLLREGWTVFGFNARATVKMFGAKMDGATDDTAAIQAALDALAGSTLELGPGFAVAAGLKIHNNTTLRGDGQKASGFVAPNGANIDLLANAGSSACGVTIEGIALDGNSGNNTAGRLLYFVTAPDQDGPALILRDMRFAGGAADASGVSMFIGGLNWVYMDKVRFVENTGSLWLSTNDSVFFKLYVGNSGMARNVPALVVGGSSNKFIGGYFGGNGAGRTSNAAQVRVFGGSANEFLSCTNDSANGHGYEFMDYMDKHCKHNKIIGGQVSNCSQAANNGHQHILFAGHSSHNLVMGVAIDNDFTVDQFTGGAPRHGAHGVVDVEMAGHNTVYASQFGTFGTSSHALATTSRIVDCIGAAGTGVDSYATVGASPYTYTNTYSRRIAVYISGGAGINITKDGFPIFNATPATISLDPNESFVIAYTAAPTIRADRK